MAETRCDYCGEMSGLVYIQKELREDGSRRLKCTTCIKKENENDKVL